MIAFELDVDDLVRALARAEDELERLLPVAMRQGGDLIVAHAKRNHDYTDRSGALTNSIGPPAVEGTVRADDLTVTVGAGAPHAAPIEYGSKPHRIVPRHRLVLRWPVEGGFRYARAVNHPGNRPYRFLENALEAQLPTITLEIEAAVDLAFHRAGFR